MPGKLIPLLIFIMLVTFLGIGLTLDPREVPSPLIDKPMPEFSLQQLEDSQKNIGSGNFVGQVALLNVWASWCIACREEHPLLLELADSGAVDIFGLNYKDKRTDAIQWLHYFGNPYLTSAHDLDGKVGIDFGVYGVPETFIIDQQGIIRYKHVGPITRQVIDDEILPLVGRLRIAEK